MLTLVEKVLFVLLSLAAAYAAFITFGRMARIILRGQGHINFEDLPDRLLKGALALFSQGNILRRRKWTSIFHYGVAWAFIFYFLVNAVDVLEGFIPNFHFFEDNFIGQTYRLLADILTITGLVGVVYLLSRRFLAKAPALTIRDNVMLHPKAQAGIRRDSFLVGAFILIHLGARFLGQSFLVAAQGSDPFQPFASLMANAWGGMSGTGLEIGWHVGWWVALGAIILFLPYFPYTKHAHLFMGPLNIMTRPRRKALGALDTLDFEDESIEQFGVSTLIDLPQTQIMDAFACIMCNRCQDACPAYQTGKELSPAALEVNKRYYIKENMAALASGELEPIKLLDFAISESAVWACTACGACIEVCPVGNEPMFDILQIRQSQVLMESSFPNELKGAFTGMERLGNPWNMTDDRLAWAAPLDFDVPTVEENPDYDILYWVGCAGAFDPNAQEIARATATILYRAGINFAVLGNEESCTGDSARRAGNDYLYFEMASTNIEKLNEIQADKRKIVTGCPHCFHTIGKEYPDLGGHYHIMHHTQLIADLVGKGRLTLANNGELESITFHDPCYLGRHNKEYDAPRDSLASAGRLLLEMDLNSENSFCCGAGGAQVWKEEEHGAKGISKPVNSTRFAQAQATGATTLALGCPFCARMLNDANAEAGNPMIVKDVAQVVAAAIQTEPHHEH
jgi:Fe-S oxidoreductase